MCRDDAGDYARISSVGVEQWTDDEDECGVKSLWMDENGEWQAGDDVKGGSLDPQRVMEARDEEMGYILRRNVWKPSSLTECVTVSGHKPLDTSA